MVQVLHETVGVEVGMMTTGHGCTDVQALVEGPHRHLRRRRSWRIGPWEAAG
jgi:glyceraldehyde 3-phosphate dehydrogenase